MKCYSKLKKCIRNEKNFTTQEGIELGTFRSTDGRSTDWAIQEANFIKIYFSFWSQQIFLQPYFESKLQTWFSLRSTDRIFHNYLKMMAEVINQSLEVKSLMLIKVGDSSVVPVELCYQTCGIFHIYQVYKWHLLKIGCKRL